QNYQGAVFFTPGPLTLTNCTVAKNSNRPDIAATPGTMTITNTVIWGNNSGVFQFGAGTVNYTLANANIPGTGNINADPLFVDINDGDGPDNTWRTADDGLLIGQCSPAVDGGNTPASATDIVGNPRLDAPVIGVSPVDMGAYEQQDVNYPVVITDISIDNMSALITNGTICSADDTFTGDVTVTFSNFSSTGSLSLAGFEILSTLTPVPIANTTTTSTHVFTGVSFIASGQATLTAAFSDMPCTYTETISPTPSAGIGYVECTPCGTPWFDDGGPTGDYTQDTTKTFCPQTTDHKAQLDFATIDLEPSGWDAMYIYDGTDNSAPQLAYFSGSYTSEIITATGANPTGCLTAEFFVNIGGYPGWEATFNCVRIFDISAGNLSACDGNNTTCGTDDTYTADITVSFASIPATGTLALSGADIIGSPP
ncbi:MAG: choice-of-anchor Q domain-containing protein, partial [Bacteroidota bacterium]